MSKAEEVCPLGNGEMVTEVARKQGEWLVTEPENKEF